MYGADARSWRSRRLTRDVPAISAIRCSNAWILAWDTSHLGRGWWNANIYLSASAGAGLTRAPAAAGARHLARSGDRAITHPQLQRCVPRDVRAVRPGHVPARARDYEQPRGGVRRGRRVCVRAVPRHLDAASAGAVVTVDAVRARMGSDGILDKPQSRGPACGSAEPLRGRHIWMAAGAAAWIVS